MNLFSVEYKIALIISTFYFFYIYSNLLVFLGKMIIGKLIINYFTFFNKYIVESFSFFLGTLISSSFIIFLSYIFGLKLAFFILVFIICFLFFKRLRFSLSFFINYKKLIIILSIIFLEIIIALIPLPSFFTYSNLQNLNPFDGFGAVVHSFRSGNISLYLLESNSVPRINQNIGQSLITTFPMFLIGKYPQINLIIWKSFLLYYSLILIYGLIINFTNDLKLILFVFLAILFGQTGLGLTYIQTVDTGSTLFFLSNTDTYICVFSFFIFYIIALYDLKEPNIYYKIVLVLVSISWNFFGAQNIILTLLIFLGFLIFYRKINMSFYLVLFFLSILSGYIFGGLLAIDISPNVYNIPGLMSVANSSELLEFKLPVLPSFNHFEFYSLLQEIFQNFYTKTYYKILVGFSSFFSVILGLVFIFYLFKVLRIRGYKDEIYFTYIFLAITLIGLFISSSLRVYGQTWELSRFYYIGNYFIIFLMTFVYLNKDKMNSNSKLVLKILYPISFIPVVFFSFFFIENNLFGTFMSYHSISDCQELNILSVSERFDCLFLFNSEVGRNVFLY